jgi:hypothetical protein
MNVKTTYAQLGALIEIFGILTDHVAKSCDTEIERIRANAEAQEKSIISFRDSLIEELNRLIGEPAPDAAFTFDAKAIVEEATTDVAVPGDPAPRRHFARDAA